MIAFQMQDIKAFMSRLLLSSAFDAFLVVEGGVTTFSSFQIDGRLRPDYYSREEQEAVNSMRRALNGMESTLPWAFISPSSSPRKIRKSCSGSQILPFPRRM